MYWKVEFSIGVSFGTNSLKAKLLWNEGVRFSQALANLCRSRLLTSLVIDRFFNVKDPPPSSSTLCKELEAFERKKNRKGK